MPRCDFTVITPTWNSASTLERALRSIRGQRGASVQHILVDGASTDGTAALASGSADAPDIVISEPDDGLYDAINKGLARREGDHVIILNADDRYGHPDVLSHYLSTFRTEGVDAVYSDLVLVKPAGSDDDTVVRVYSSSRFSPRGLAWGWMPAHPTLAVTSDLVAQVGDYRTDYSIAADYEWCIRAFVVEGCSYAYLPETSVRMNVGGVSTSGLRATLLLNREVMRACRDNDLSTSWPKLLSKYPRKISGLVAAHLRPRS